MKKQHVLTAMLLFVFALFWAFPAQAATEERYKTDSEWQTGTVTVTDTQTGKDLAVLYLRTLKINPDLVVDGDTIYFDAYRSEGYDKTYNYLYSYKISEKKYTLLKELPSGYYGYDVSAKYNGSLYITGWNPSDNNRTYRYTIKSGKLTKITDAAYVMRYKHYIVLDPTKTYGSWNTFPVYMYNSKSGKVKTAAKKCVAYTMKSGKLYMAEMKTSGNVYPGNTQVKYKITRYTIKSGKKKTLKKTVKAYMIRKITSKYIYHVKENYPNTTYYRTKISSGKRKTISEAEFREAVGY